MDTYRNKITVDDFCKYADDPAFIKAKVLYKYRDWSNPFHRSILTDNKVYLASPSSFEDELDCNVPESFPTKEELPALFWDKSFSMIPLASVKERIAWVLQCCIDSPLADITKRDEVVKQLKDLNDSTFGVLSLTANPHNDKMWEKYGASNKGVCFGFDKDKLFNVVGGGGPVIYTDNLPIIRNFIDDTMTQHIKRTFFKNRKKWEFEEEYRLHKRWPLDNPPSDDDRNIQMLDDTIVEILLGSAMPDQYKNEIRSIAAKQCPNAKIIEL